jgi:uncharacterized protein
MSEISYNESLSRYEQAVDGHMVYATVHRKGGVLYIDYVHADPALRGGGAAGRFMAGLMEIARAEGLKVDPICGYAAGWLRRHGEYADLRVD